MHLLGDDKEIGIESVNSIDGSLMPAVAGGPLAVGCTKTRRILNGEVDRRTPRLLQQYELPLRSDGYVVERSGPHEGMGVSVEHDSMRATGITKSAGRDFDLGVRRRTPRPNARYPEVEEGSARRRGEV